MRREKEKLDAVLSGIRDMTKTPSVLWVIDTKKEQIAVDEARKLGIPVVAILDTNCDPDEVEFPIPGNDDAIRAISLLTRVVADAVAEGLQQRPTKNAGAAGVIAEPLTDWEKELLAGNQDAIAEAVASTTPESTTEIKTEEGK